MSSDSNVRLAVGGLLSLVSDQPFVGPFAQTLQALMKLCDAIMLNEENAEKFQLTLGDAAAIIKEAVSLAESDDGNSVKFDIVKRFVDELTSILEDAIRSLNTFTQKGWLRKVISAYIGSSPSETFQEYDNKINKKLNALNLALNISQQKLLEVNYAKLEGIEQWCKENGGLESFLGDQTKLDELATKLDAKVEVIRDEIVFGIEELKKLSEKMLEKQDVLLEFVLEQFRVMSKNIDGLEGSFVSGAASVSASASERGYPSIEWKDLDFSAKDVIGEGGFAVVYKGKYNDRPVAIKGFKSSVRGAIDDKTWLGLRREVASLAAVTSHPFIIQLLGANLNMQDSSHPLCMVLELADGSLYDALYTSRIVDFDRSLFNKVRIMLDVAKAMAFVCERCNIVFRDLKPMNILLVDNVPKLADFGLAKRDVDITSRDSIVSAKGTPAYMAPEVFKYAHRNPKMDVYSFGVVLNELLTEQIPFEGLDKFLISHATTTGERPDKYKPPSGPSDVIGNALVRIVTVCWQADPSSRPSFTNVVNDLTKIVMILMDVTKCGNSSAIAREAIKLESTIAIDFTRRKRPLTSLSIDEVVTLSRNLNLPDECEAIVRRRKLDGNMLNAVTSFDEVKELELPLDNLRAKVLWNSLDAIRQAGGGFVSPELLMAVDPLFQHQKSSVAGAPTATGAGASGSAASAASPPLLATPADSGKGNDSEDGSHTRPPQSSDVSPANASSFSSSFAASLPPPPAAAVATTPLPNLVSDAHGAAEAEAPAVDAYISDYEGEGDSLDKVSSSRHKNLSGDTHGGAGAQLPSLFSSSGSATAATSIVPPAAAAITPTQVAAHQAPPDFKALEIPAFIEAIQKQHKGSEKAERAAKLTQLDSLAPNKMVQLLREFGTMNIALARQGCNRIKDRPGSFQSISNICDALVDVLKVYGTTNADVTKACCEAIGNIMNDGNKSKYGSIDGSIEALVDVLNVYGTINVDVAEACCEAIRNITRNNDDNKSKYGSIEGSIEALVDVLKDYGTSNAKVARACCDAIYNITRDNDDNISKYGSIEGSIEALVNIFKVNGKNESYSGAMSHCCWAIYYLCLGSSLAASLNKLKFNNLNAIHILTNDVTVGYDICKYNAIEALR